jgi:hypothetical protein
MIYVKLSLLITEPKEPFMMVKLGSSYVVVVSMLFMYNFQSLLIIFAHTYFGICYPY